MTAAGGIGIAKMIAKQLHKAADMQGAAATKVPRPTPNSQLQQRNSTVFKASTNRLKNLSGNADSSIVETGEVAMKIEGVNPVATQLPVDSVTVRISSRWAS